MDDQKENKIKDERFLSLKAQKLTQAIYLVTSLISDNEPLKWRLRDESLDILSDMSLGHNHQISPFYKLPALEKVISKVNSLISFLDVSLTANFISEMNLILLKKEYLAFRQSLEEKLEEGNNINQLLEAPLFPEKTTDKLPIFNPSRSGHNPHLSITGQTSNPKKSAEYLKINRLPHKNRDFAKNSRRSIILDFLKGKDWTSIRDITDAVDGCSAKTIQRELADLVNHGVLKKKGDRRWSRYILA